MTDDDPTKPGRDQELQHAAARRLAEKHNAALRSAGMDALFRNLPDHVRVSQKRGVTGIVGHRGSRK
jgi:hypothetical protein